jgi:hypothetical protein
MLFAESCGRFSMPTYLICITGANESADRFRKDV